MPKVESKRKIDSKRGKLQASPAKNRQPVQDAPPQYEVEVITKARLLDDGTWEYLVKWAGYGSEDDSWEPEENVKECTRLLKSFKDETDLSQGADVWAELPCGFEVAAKDDWIEEERERFRTTFGPPKKTRVAVKKELKDEDEVEAVLVPQADEAEELGKSKARGGRKSARRGKASPKKRRT